MAVVFEKANVYANGVFNRANAVFSNGCLSFSPNTPTSSNQFNNCLILPGFVDVHVHLREPGFSYKETIKTGTLAAARGGVVGVCSMPNLTPVPDSVEHLKVQTDIIRRDAVVRVFPYGSVTVGENGKELSDMKGLSPNVVAFSDDGKGVQSDGIMEEAMKKAKAEGKIIAAHCEVNELLKGGYIHDGIYAKEHNHKGICSESEYKQIERDIALAEKIGCKYHVCHISTKESVDLIRKAKKRGVDITCETGPHYLLLSENDLREEGRFKMNPPLRSEEDRQALIEGIIDGTVDMIATDHAPHSQEEKSRGLQKSAMGVVGIETAFPLLYTGLVEKGIITLEKLMCLMIDNPKKRFGIDTGSDFTVFDMSEQYEITPNDFLSKGRATPFEGVKVKGRCLLTFSKEKIAYIDERIKGE